MSIPVYFIPAASDEEPTSLAAKADRVLCNVGFPEKIDRENFVGLKIHFGETGNTGHIKPAWLKSIIKTLKRRSSHLFLTDTNTLYTGRRSNSIEHLRLAWEHGFGLESLGIPVVIADGLIGRNSDEREIKLPRILSAKIASAFLNTDALLCLSHFTGHVQSGFGAVIKNLGMGCASRAGKLEQHSDVIPRINPRVCNNCAVCLDYCPENAIVQNNESAVILEEMCIGCGECLVVCNFGAVKMRWDGDTIRIQEKMAEYAFAVTSLYGDKFACLNFLLTITRDCDCMSQKGRTIASDIGILGSTDPVALDQASVDLLLDSEGRDVLKEAHGVDWAVQLKHGEQVGLGRRQYTLIEID